MKGGRRCRETLRETGLLRMGGKDALKKCLMLKTCELCVHLKRDKVKDICQHLGQECMCGQTDTRGQHLEENW